MQDGAALIGIDWGTTSFRAYRIAADGACSRRRTAPAGILKVAGRRFRGRARARDRRLARRRAGRCRCSLSGMITSPPGLGRGALLPLPRRQRRARRARSGGTRPRPGGALHFVPGLSLIGADGVPDVIRGEETQILGELGGGPGRRSAALIVLPGHPQQVGARRGRPDRLVRDLHDRRAVRRAQGAQHPRPADGGRRARTRPPSRAASPMRAAGRAGCSSGCSARARSACSTSCRRAPSPPICPGC